jgi:hypothetical protein
MVLLVVAREDPRDAVAAGARLELEARAGQRHTRPRGAVQSPPAMYACCTVSSPIISAMT